jgi:hypothetical protein
MRIILLTGWSESGKDTVADILVKEYRFKKYAFADPLKDLCASLYGFPRELANTQEGKRNTWQVGTNMKTIRQLLLETALVDRARFGDDIYAREILERILLDMPENVVISDLRYYTEIACFKQMPFEIWKVVREDQTNSPVQDPSEHMLETLNPNQTIMNDGKSMENLRQKVSEAFSRRNKNELSNPKNEDDGCRIM